MTVNTKTHHFTEKKSTVNLIQLNYVEGPNNGQPLILIPGQGGTWESYEKVLQSLSERFRVFAVDVRGHGKSSWTTGEYNFTNIGEDFTAFLNEVVGAPAIVSGNSSGGLMALWLAANKPDLVKGIILEDAPLFSADWPRIKEEFVYEVLEKTAHYLSAKGGPDYEGLLRSIEKPGRDGKTRGLPKVLVRSIVWLTRVYKKPGEPLDIPLLPSRLRRLFKSISTFDPDFSKAWVDGRIYEGLNHVEALSRVKSPIMVIHADWYRTEKGLVGAMDDDDAKKVKALVPYADYVRIKTSHVTHAANPKLFTRYVIQFAEKMTFQAFRN